jgi:branched-chain amino acid transport system ATP-binding protein
MLTVQQLSVYYGTIRALDDISLHVNKAELVALIGSNGAGKSTTLKTISGLLRPPKGTIHFEETDITRSSTDTRVRLGIAHCPEGRRIFGSLTVRENLRLGAVQRQNQSEIARDLDWVLTLFPRLGERLDRREGHFRGANSKCWRYPAH